MLANTPTTLSRKFENGPRFFKAMARRRPQCRPISSTHPASPIPLLHRWLPDRFCLNNQPAIHTSCTSNLKISLCGWPASLLLLSSLEADGLRSHAHSKTCSGQESRLNMSEYYAVGPDSFSLDCYAQFEPCRCCRFTLVG